GCAKPEAAPWTGDVQFDLCSMNCRAALCGSAPHREAPGAAPPLGYTKGTFKRLRTAKRGGSSGGFAMGRGSAERRSADPRPIAKPPELPPLLAVRRRLKVPFV